MKLKISLGLAALMALMGSQSLAADLGGNCCADLEERVSELEATVARKGNRKVSLEISGHINEAVLFATGDGFDEHEIIDNENSESRFRFKGAAKINQGWSAGFLLELGLSSAVNAGDPPTVRHSALYFNVKNLGTIWLGHTSTATDGIMEISLSNANTAATLGSLAPFDSAFKRATGFGVDNPFDGGRRGVVAFRSADLSGFSISASWSDDDSYDAALRYAGEFGSIRITAGAGYRKDEVSPMVGASGSREFMGGSISVMELKTGLFVDAIYAESDGVQTGSFAVPLIGDVSFGIGDAKVTIMGGRAGVEYKASPLGTTTLFGEYQELDISGMSIKPTIYGVGVVQNIDAAALSIYADYRKLDADLGSGTDADVIVVGAKIKF